MNLRRTLCITALLIVAALAGFAHGLTPPVPPPTGPNFKDTPGKHLDILRDGKPLLRYMYEYDPGTAESLSDTYKVYAHVFAPDGTTLLTKGPGGLFPHHRGIFIGWNGIECQGKKLDLWHMKGTVIKHSGFNGNSASDAKFTRFSAQIRWSTDADQKPFMTEKRSFVVHHDDPAAHLTLDCTSELLAVAADVSLNMDPEHGGFQFRPSQEVAENKSAKYTFPTDKPDLKKEKDLPWAAMTCKIGGETWTVQYMNAPTNPKGAVYSAYRDYGRFGSCIKTTIKNRETLTLNYRLRITKGEAPNREELQKQYDAFDKSKATG